MTLRQIGNRARTVLLLAAAFLASGWLRADPTLPPKPATYFSDQAGVIDPATASQLNEQLAQFERDTSSQIVVALYPSLPEAADLSQYATATYNSWVIDKKNGQMTGGSNGAALLIFVNSHQMFIATGRDLEGALPDITCRQIIENEIAPRFKQGDYAGGVRAGIDAMVAATKGEYKGTGQTSLEKREELAAERQQEIIIGIVIAIFVISFFMRSRFPGLAGGPYIYTGGGFGSGFGGGWGGGGGGGSSGFGGFSGGGGGGSAGGGAGGSW